MASLSAVFSQCGIPQLFPACVKSDIMLCVARTGLLAFTVYL